VKNFKLVILVLMLLFPASSFAVVIEIQTSSGATYIGNTASYPTAMPITGSITVTLGSVAVTLPVYYDSTGAASAAVLSQSGSVPVMNGVRETETPTDFVCGPTATAISPIAGQKLIRITHRATETVWIAENSSVATVGYGLPLFEGGVYEEYRDTPTAVISSTPAALNSYQAR